MMKVIIFDNGASQIYLHINKICRIFTHKYNRYTRVIIYMRKYQILINDFVHIDFATLIREFIESNEKLKIIKVKDVTNESGDVYVTLVDWVSEAMGK